MNLAHIHLTLNHLPVVGLPIALMFLSYGVYRRNSQIERFSLFVLICLAALVLPIYFTGEPAEKVIENLPGITEDFIESHEDAAMFSLVLTLAMGAAAVIGLWIEKDEKKFRLGCISVLVFGFLSVASLFYTANKGGQIRHTEIRSDN